MTQGAERTLNETGEFLGDVGERVQDFFNGTDSGQAVRKGKIEYNIIISL
jgi:hypothetical protein